MHNEEKDKRDVKIVFSSVQSFVYHDKLLSAYRLRWVSSVVLRNVGLGLFTLNSEMKLGTN